MSFFYHILIPTRERAKTLKWTLKSCLHQDLDNFKVWVSDNKSGDGTAEVVKELMDEPNGDKIEYRVAPKRLSMSGNYEFILNEVLDYIKDDHNEYIIFVGDDDAVIPDSLGMLDKVLNKDSVLGVSWVKPVYLWADIGKSSIPGLLHMQRMRSNYKRI